MTTKGEETRLRILREALEQVSKVGFEGLTIGTLAERLGLSKSGLFAHFGSREDLQLATLDLAASEFRRDILEPAVKKPRGLPRLMSLLAHWFARYPRGGCVFLAGSAEYDDRPGKMHQALQSLHREWRASLSRAVLYCVETGDLQPETDPDQVAFELFAFSAGAHHDLRLYGESETSERLRRAVERLLRSFGAPAEGLEWPAPENALLSSSAES